jgi:aspartate-semialdehyde dehydrogenase
MSASFCFFQLYLVILLVQLKKEFAVEYPVISKASAHRMEEDIPLLIPEVNPEQLNLIPIQKKNRGWKGFISTDPNCSTIQLGYSGQVYRHARDI